MREKKRRVFFGVLFALAFLFLVPKARTWNAPNAHENWGPMTINGVKALVKSLSYFADLSRNEGARYLNDGHGYILEHSIEILRNDGYTNWSEIAMARLLDLVSGAVHADAYRGRVTITLQMDILFGLISADIAEFDLTCAAGCDHYYNCEDGTGLDLTGWSIAAGGANYLVKILPVNGLRELTGGLVDWGIEVSPDIRAQYPSNISLLKKHYDNAVKTWKTGHMLHDGRSWEESAMYELGWACHLMADLAVAQHLHESFLGAHGDYENFADGKGENPIDEDDKNYHAASAKSVYPFSKTAAGQGDVTLLAKRLAEFLYYKHPENFTQAESDDDADREAALQTALPLAEQYTAALIAQFMTDVELPKTTPPLEGYVRRGGGGTVPGAYVFYGIRPIMVEQNVDITKLNLINAWKGWSYVRTDGSGRFSIPVKPKNWYWIRPAMPGYCFNGRTGYNAEFGKKVSPYEYYQEAGLTSGNTIDFFLDPLPAVVKALAAPDAATVTKAWDASILHAVRPELISSLSTLDKSGTTLSPALEETISKSLMKADCNHSVLGALKSQTGLPEEATVTLRFSDLVEIVQAKTLTSTQAIIDSIDDVRSELKTAQLKLAGAALKADIFPREQKASVLDLLSKKQWQALKKKLPEGQVVETVRGSGRLYTFSAMREGSEGSVLLLQNGLVSIPSYGGAEIEVSTVPGVGLLGAGTVPIKLTTNSAGTTAFKVKSGTHAGKLRLQFKVLKNPAAVQILPQGTLEILIHPRLTGFDPKPEKDPVLEPIVQLKAVVASIPHLEQAYRTTIQIRPDGLFEKAAPPLKAEAPAAVKIDPGVVEKEPAEKSEMQPGLHLQIVTRDERRVLQTIPDARIEVYRETEKIASGQADAAGLYTVFLEKGRYRLDVGAPGFPPRPFQVEYDPDHHLYVVDQFRLEAPIVNEARPDVIHWIFLGGEREAEKPVREPLREPQREVPRKQAEGGGSAFLELRVVEDERGYFLPLPGAQIELKQEERLIQPGVSGEDGLFRAGPLRPGIYQVFVFKDGFNKVGTDVQIAEGEVRRQIVLNRIQGQRDERIERPLPKEKAEPPFPKDKVAPLPPREERLANLNLRIMEEVPRIGLTAVPEAQIIILRGNQNVAAGKSDSQGRSTVRLSFGSYVIQVKREPYYEPLQMDVTFSKDNDTREIILKRRR